MPSIFIWKAITTSTTHNTSKKMIKIYSGSNWVLEENESCSISKSYIYLDQIVISKSNDLLITFHTKNMPLDWVGSDLLEVSCVSYEMIKSDAVGTLEIIGEWMRFTTNAEIEYSVESLKAEYNIIQKWISNTVEQNTHQKPKISNSKNILDPQKIQLDFQKFLIKYSI
jgi:hypothetical protein